jgi:RNA recognition motif-containing protein
LLNIARYHRFIEYYDVRDADRAMKHLNKTEVMGKKIKIEPSRPGGSRRTPSPSSPKTFQPFVNQANTYTGLFGEFNGNAQQTPQQQQQPQRSRGRSNHEDRRRFALNLENIRNGIDIRTSKYSS